MKYKIGEIANLLGVSIETVRHYEKMGLVKPQRDSDNGYRLFDPVDLNILRRARQLMKMGYSTNDAMQMLAGGDLSDLAQSLEGRMEDLDKQIAYLRHLQSFVSQRKRHLQRISCMPVGLVVENSPPMYGIIYRNGRQFTQDEDQCHLLKQWNHFSPFAEASVVIPQAYWRRQSPVYQQGVCIEAQYADFFGIHQGGQVQYYPSRKSLYTLFTTPYEPDVAKRSDPYVAGHVAQALERGQYQLAGDTIGRVLHTSRKNGAYVHYSELWIPIAE